MDKPCCWSGRIGEPRIFLTGIFNSYSPFHELPFYS
jgi:hypothetical protein